MRAREPFTLYKRKLTKEVVFYYVAYDKEGRRRKYSTGCTNRSQALAYTMELFKTDSLIPVKKEPIAVLTFGVYAKASWTSDCDYVKAEGLRRKSICRGY